MTQHTPDVKKSWVLTIGGNYTITDSTRETLRFVAISTTEGKDIALVPVYEDQERADEIARLIAAAPQLVTALEEIYDCGSIKRAEQIAEAAIAKATQ